MSANKNVAITLAARKKLLRARAGDATLPKVSSMIFGDGGVTSDGTVIAPAENQTGLKHELMRKAVSGHTYPNETTCRYTCELLENELAGKEISEIGLVDTDGDVLCIKTFTRKGKDDDVRQTYTIDDVF